MLRYQTTKQMYFLHCREGEKMTLFYKLALFSVVIGTLTALLTCFYEFNYPLVYAVLFTLFILFLGLSGVVEKKTIKVLGTEVLGLSAVLLGSVYILFSLVFLYMIVLAFFDAMIFDGVYETLTILWVVLIIFYFLLPENENIQFGIMRPWFTSEQEKTEQDAKDKTSTKESDL